MGDHPRTARELVRAGPKASRDGRVKTHATSAVASSVKLPRRRAPLSRPVIFASLALPLAGVATHGLEHAGRAVVHAVLARQLSRTLGAPVTFEGFTLRRDGLELRGTTVSNARDHWGMRVATVRVALDWRGVVSGGVHVRSIALDGVAVDATLTAGRADAAPIVTPAALDRALADAHRAGLEQVEVTHGTLRLVRGSHRDRAAGVNASLRLARAGATFEMSADDALIDDESGRALRVRGTVDSHGIAAELSSPALMGGALTASARYDIAGESLHVRVATPGLPIEHIAQRAGVLGVHVDGAIRGDAEADFVDGGFRGARANLALAGAAFSVGSRDFAGDLQVRIEATRDRVKVYDLRTQAPGLNLDADVALVRDASEHWTVRSRGAVRADGSAIQRVAGYFGGAPLDASDAHSANILPDGVSWRARRARVTFDVHGRLDDLRGLAGSARVHVDGLALRLARTAPLLEFDSIETQIVPSAHGVALRDLDARMQGLRVRGSLALSGRSALAVDRFSADATIAVSDFATVRALAPNESLWTQLGFDRTSAARAVIHAQGSLADRADRTLSATLSVDRIRVGHELRMPDGHSLDLAVSHAEGEIRIDARRDGIHVAVHNGRADTAIGHVDLNARFDNGVHHLEASARDVDARVARWILPGTVLNGVASGTVRLDGDASMPVRTADGRFAVRDARYVLPPEVHLSTRPLRVSESHGAFRFDRGRVAVTGLELHSELGDADGTVTVVDTVPTIRANITTRNVPGVLDLFPPLVHLAERGAARGMLELRVDRRGVYGSVVARVSDATIRIPGAPNDIALQPVASGDLRMQFDPASFTIQSLTVRGPKVNMDFHTAWAFEGAVRGGGRVWLTQAYSQSMMRGFNWLATILGQHTLHSDFTLSGTSDRVRLQAGIARTLLWRLGSGRIPRAVRDVVAGRAPIGA